MKSQLSLRIPGGAGGEHVALRVHRHRKRVVTAVGGAVEGLLPEQGPVGGELRDREVLAGAGIHGEAGGEHVALRVHRHRLRLVSTIGGAIEGLLPEQGPVAGELHDREVPAGAGILGDAGGEHVAFGVHRHRQRRVVNVGGAVEGLLPEQGPVGGELRDREVLACAAYSSVKPAASTLPSVSTATEYASSRPLAVPLSVCCQSRVPSGANFATVKSAPVPVFAGDAGGEHVPVGVHRHREPRHQRWRCR